MSDDDLGRRPAVEEPRDQPSTGAAPPSPALPPEPRLRPADAFAALLLAVFAALSLAGVLALGLVGRDGLTAARDSGQIDLRLLAIGGLSGQASFALAVGLVLTYRAVPARVGLALRRVAARALAWAALGTVAFSLVGDWLGATVHQLFPDLPSAIGLAAELMRELHGPALVGAVAVLALVPAICEEGLFRGLIYKAFESRWGPGPAVWGSAAAFAAIHLDVVQTPAAFAMGWYLGKLRQRSGSLYPAMAGHAANNAIAGVLMLSGASGSVAVETGAWTAPLVGAGVVVGTLCLRALPREPK